MAGFCTYCGSHIAGKLTVEHVIPQDIGGNLEIAACEPCNGGAARHVDNPLMADPRVAMLRALYDVRSPKKPGQRPKAQFVGQLTDGGGRALYRPQDRAADLEQVLPSEPVLKADGTFTIATPVKDSEKHLEAALQKLRQANPGKTIEVVKREQRRGDVVFEHSWNILPWVWPRFAAKVALGLGAIAMPSEWQASEPAGMLRGLFRFGKTYKGMFPAGYELPVFPVELDQGDREPDLLLPREHLLYALPVDGGMHFGGVLFGELRFGICVATHLQPTGRTVGWVLDGTGSPAEEPLDTLVGWLEYRRNAFGGTRRFRVDHPRAVFKGVIHGASAT